MKTYELKKGDYLFRKADVTDVLQSMFFGFSVYDIGSSNSKSDKIQVWQVRENFLPMYAIKHYEREGTITEHRISSLPDIYLEKYPTDKGADYLTIKNYSNNVRRKNLIDILLTKKVESWVTSVENTFCMELFIFGGVEKNKAVVEFKGYAKKDVRGLYDFDYFDKTRIR
jgi:hypothetical protein